MSTWRTWIACLSVCGLIACRTPTLWVGTALLSDAGATLGAAGDAPLGAQPAAAGLGGVGGHIDKVGGNVPPAAAEMPPDAGLSQARSASRDAGPKAQTPAATRDTQAADDDAGTGTQPTGADAPLQPTKLPSLEGPCPELKGNGTHMFSAGGRNLMVDIYMRPDAKSQPAPGGPLILYFHAVDSDSSQVSKALGQPAIDAVVAQGGVVASFNAVPCLRCGLADDVVWYDEDDVISDQVVACAIQQAQIDTRRIHAMGFSAGALHTMHLALALANYIASVVSYSGGTPTSPKEAQDPTNKVPALLAFGREGFDYAILDFNVNSRDWYDTFVPRGYYVLMCDHDRGHELVSELIPHGLRFLLDHPYRVNPEPYATTIPSEFPSYCRNSP